MTALIPHDDIKDLAPDRKAFATAKKLANAASWSAFGQESNVLWGSAKGSSGDDYYVYVNTQSRALECSCPSRKRPCKHALALVIMQADGVEFPQNPVPAGHQYEAQTRYYSTWE